LGGLAQGDQLFWRGPCHTGRATCFYRWVPLKQTDLRRLILHLRNGEKAFEDLKS
jgi:hypothetical protein